LELFLMSRPLLQAAANGDLKKIRQHLANGADVNCIHKATGRTPLIEAVIHGHREVAKALLDAGAEINQLDTAVGYSPLLWACQQGQLELVELLLSVSANVNDRSPEFGWTPLLAASHVGSLAIVRRLLDAGADLHASTTDGRTAVALARAVKKDEVAGMLEDLGCRADCTGAAPLPLPWPDVGEDASKVDFTRPEAVVRGLIIAMNRFETEAPTSSSQDSLMAMLADVFARYCTDKKRTYGRQGSYRTPPEYDPDAEYLIRSTIINPRRAELVTRSDNSRTEFLYVLQRKAGVWRVDNKKLRLVGSDWIPWHI
jgi:ankyrin repeat protein